MSGVMTRALPRDSAVPMASFAVPLATDLAKLLLIALMRFARAFTAWVCALVPVVAAAPTPWVRRN